MYEPIHGSAPDIAGQGKANPLATILSASMLVKYSMGDDDLSDRIDGAVERTLEDGLRTADIFEEGTQLVSTSEMGAAVVKNLG